MAADEKAGVISLLMILGMVAIGDVFAWWKVVKEGQIWNEQRPAMCSDGRLKNASFDNISFSVDDTFEDDSGVQMWCSIPVYVYPCPDNQNSFCREFESPVPLPTPRVWWENTNLVCTRQSDLNVLGNVCRHEDFECADGACTAFEKAGRLCAANMVRKDTYECYYIPSKVEFSVRTAQTPFPLWWFLLAVVITLVSAPFTYVITIGMVKVVKEDGIQGIAVECCTIICFILCISLSVPITMLAHVKKPKGAIAINMTQYTANGGVEALPDEEPIPVPGALEIVFIVVAIFAFTVCCSACIIGSFIMAGKWRRARELTSRTDTSEDSEASTALVE